MLYNIDQMLNSHYLRHCENFWAFTGPRIDLGLILLIPGMIIHRSFTSPTHLLPAKVWGWVSFVVSVISSNRVSYGMSISRTWAMLWWHCIVYSSFLYAMPQHMLYMSSLKIDVYGTVKWGNFGCWGNFGQYKTFILSNIFCHLKNNLVVNMEVKGYLQSVICFKICFKRSFIRLEPMMG